MYKDGEEGAVAWRYLYTKWNTTVDGIPFFLWIRTLSPDILAAVRIAMRMECDEELPAKCDQVAGLY